MASIARPGIQQIRSRRAHVTVQLDREKRETALNKLVTILEDQMTDVGLSEEAKNEKTAELVGFVNATVASRFVSRAK
jgi:hypothetical protein